jgi:hypothetical protein
MWPQKVRLSDRLSAGDKAAQVRGDLGAANSVMIPGSA